MNNKRNRNESVEHWVRRIEFQWDVAKRVEWIMELKNIDQKELVRRCRKKKSCISRFLSGDVNASGFYLQEVAMGLEVFLFDMIDLEKKDELFEVCKRRLLKPNFMKRLNKRVKFLMREQEIIASKLAINCGKTESDISRFLRGKKNSSGFYLLEIAEGLGVSLWVLMEI